MPERGAIPTGSPFTTAQGETILAIGSKVITSFGNVGTIERLDKEVAEVLVGGMRLREKIVNLQLAEQPVAEARTTVRESSTSGLSRNIDGYDIPAELNLIGKTTADAEYEIDRFLDEAYMSSLPRVRIIHGFGTGALKNYVHHFLKGHAHVAKYGFAPSDQGGNGATIAELKG
ncbi:MAG: Smr/MutS family protein [Acidobacteria bacterium]|nr:Smr/MutS family protein [Acidobacteriota bacterium]